MIGHVSKDIIKYMDEENRVLGGGVVYASAAASKSGKSVTVITSAAECDDSQLDGMRENGVEVHRIDSEKTTSIENIYYSEDKERRKVSLLSQAKVFTAEMLPDVNSRIYCLTALFRGEIPDEFITIFSRKGRVAVDAQGLLRCNESGTLAFRDWDRKRELLPYIDFFKTDAAEAEILTGETDREKAAEILASWGAKEVMVTHNTEITLFGGGKIHKAPFTPENLTGRTGRGDTTFGAYLAWRLDHDLSDSVRYAAALCSIKMERPGPFSGEIDDVIERMKRDASRR